MAKIRIWPTHGIVWIFSLYSPVHSNIVCIWKIWIWRQYERYVYCDRCVPSTEFQVNYLRKHRAKESTDWLWVSRWKDSPTKITTRASGVCECEWVFACEMGEWRRQGSWSNETSVYEKLFLRIIQSFIFVLYRKWIHCERESEGERERVIPFIKTWIYGADGGNDNVDDAERVREVEETDEDKEHISTNKLWWNLVLDVYSWSPYLRISVGSGQMRRKIRKIYSTISTILI